MTWAKFVNLLFHGPLVLAFVDRGYPGHINEGNHQRLVDRIGDIVAWGEENHVPIAKAHDRPAGVVRLHVVYHIVAVRVCRTSETRVSGVERGGVEETFMPKVNFGKFAVSVLPAGQSNQLCALLACRFSLISMVLWAPLLRLRKSKPRQGMGVLAVLSPKTMPLAV